MRTTKDQTIDSLKQELQRLEITSHNLRNIISSLEEQERTASESTPSADRVRKGRPPKAAPETPIVRDLYGNTIQVGDTVDFLTKGKVQSFSGTVERFSKNLERVFSRDSEGRVIARAPTNLHVRSNNATYTDHVE